MSAVYDVQGSKLYVGPSGSPTPTSQVAQLKSIRPPQGKRSWKDQTDLDATNARTGKPGLIDWGEFSVSAFWDDSDAGQAALWTAFKANTQQAAKIVFQNGTQWEFNGYVLQMSPPSMDVDGDLMADITFRVNGDITVTAS